MHSQTRRKTTLVYGDLGTSPGLSLEMARGGYVRYGDRRVTSAYQCVVCRGIEKSFPRSST